MIRFFRSWCEGIIVAVVISIIIETILPEGSHKKYVKVVVGIYMIFTILNPFLGKLNDIDFGDIDLPTVQTSTNLDNDKEIKQLYLEGIKETLKNNIKENFGYEVLDLQISYDENFENIEKMNIKIKKSDILQIEKVEIGNNIQKEETQNYAELIDYIQKNYQIKPENIIVN